MSARLIDLLLRLSPRERGLLAIAVFVVGPLVVVFGLLLPLTERREAALQTEAEAVALHNWVQDRAAEQVQYGAAPQQVPQPAIGSSGIEQQLIDAQLRPSVSELATQAGGVVELRFDEVDFIRLANWMTSAHPDWGYAIASFRFEASDSPGKIAAWLVLRPQQG
ncbi:General secretion pathway, M protein [Thalassovita gelatinovora]|uniref:General secretion pathway, M protein n=1 Tax=Thalassovita gelatinovora TaxID=53501 RepID=A0A0P1F6E6_THAGE|nr:type II secretion system protein GspM [Thalassovita gelatinovora]QIZ80953.1 type II secretion system protein M [Thalassovita gelatinovora]CUH63483.1 General secretion pathway, M protein [Thalassovita gelatinovora]SEQ67664.1 Type II secretory pathway, component PulM [Thalassovita gelatinovora]